MGRKKKITLRDQAVAADILTRFCFVKDFDDLWRVYKDVYDYYELMDDPFTNLPCTPDEYYKNSVELDKQINKGFII